MKKKTENENENESETKLLRKKISSSNIILFSRLRRIQQDLLLKITELLM